MIARMTRLTLILVVMLLAACAPAIPPSPTDTPNAPTMPTITVTAAPAQAATATTAPTLTDAPPTSTPHPLDPFTLAALRERTYPAGAITITEQVLATATYTRYLIEYPSDGLTITGVMHIPTSEPPFPVLILNHGYWPRETYTSGNTTNRAAEEFAARGYLTLAPDYRSWGGSDDGLSLFHIGLVIDMLNLVSAAESLPQADASRIGLWGHSMGGGISMKAVTVDARIGAAVLYASNSADDADLIARWGAGCLPDQSEAAGDFCNPAEAIPDDTPSDILNLYAATAHDPAHIQRVAPFYHLDQVRAPLQIHIGTADGQSLGETPPEWSYKLHSALNALHIPVTMYTYEGQGHFFQGESWYLMVERAITFFDANL